MFAMSTTSTNPNPTVWLRFLGIVIALSAVALSGCTGQPNEESGIAELRRFGTQLAFKQYLGEQIQADQWTDWWYGNDSFDLFANSNSAGVWSTPLPSAGQVPDSADQRPDGPTANLDGFSTTNIQEEGVDEADVVKNDGTYIYVIGDDMLQIVRAIPADDMAVASTTELPGRFDEAYLRADLLIALGSNYSEERGRTVAIVTILDVSDRGAPALQTTIEADGDVVSSRMIGSKLHLVLSTWPRAIPSSPLPALLFSDIDALIPDITVTGADGSSVSRNLVAWQDFYYPVDPNGYQITAVVTLDVEAPDEPQQSVAVMADAGTVYASTTALYLTDTDYGYGGDMRETTDVYRFDLGQQGPTYVGSTSVPGRLLNRFSLGEHNGYLRAATTVGHVSRSGDNTAKNNVYVLGAEDGGLKVVGSVEDIAPGERIYSARFIGDRGFMVTFKKVDPLFTLDLSDPTAPRVVGELKVPGYSDYIHPLGENHLLTIGKDAIDVGDFAWYQGVQLSVFDVTDFANPQRLDVEIVGDRGTHSEALTNPHAFNFFPPTDTLAVPMQIAEGAGTHPSDHGEVTFEGLCLYRVTTEEGIEPMGRIATGSRDVQVDPWYWYTPWTRGIFMGDYVFAVTRNEVSVVPLDDLSATPLSLRLGSTD